MADYKIDPKTGDYLIDANGDYVIDSSTTQAPQPNIPSTEQNNSSIYQTIDRFLPRTVTIASDTNESIPEKISKYPISFGLDVATVPGRAIAGTVGGLATGLGTYLSNGENPTSEAIKTGVDIFSRKGGNPKSSTLEQIGEAAIKDPLLFIPGLGETGVFKSIATNPIIREAIAQGISNFGSGLLENFVDKTRSIGEDLPLQTILGAGLGGATKGVSNILEKFGSSDAANAILKKFTPSEKNAGLNDRLASQIQQGYDVDIRDKNGKISPEKLGEFLDNQTRGLPGERAERWTQWISDNASNVGKTLGEEYKKGSTALFTPDDNINPEAKRINVGKMMEDIYSSYFPKATLENNMGQKVADRGAIRDFITDINNNHLPKRQISEFEQRINQYKDQGLADNKAFEQALNDFENAPIKEMSTPAQTETGEAIVVPENNLTPEQIRDFNQYLFNAGRENSPKYHPSTEKFAAELRSAISDAQQKNLGESGKLMPQYSALSTLENLTNKSNYFSPDRPKTFYQGITEQISSLPTGKIGNAADYIGRGIKAAVRGQTRTSNQTPTETETNYFTSTDENHFRQLINNMPNNSDKRAAARALDALHSNPRDQQAKNDLQRYLNL